MDKFLLILQAKLDEAKSKGLINADIKKIQKLIDKLKLQAEMDPKALNTAQKMGQEIGQTVIDATQKAINDKKINADKLNADIQTLVNNLNNFSSKNAGFSLFKTEINGVEVSLDSLISKLSTVDNTTDLSTCRSQAAALKSAFTELQEISRIQSALGDGTYDTKITTLENQFKKLGLTQDEVAAKMKSVKTAYAELSSSNISQEQLIQLEQKFNAELNSSTNHLQILKTEMGEFASTSIQVNLTERIEKWLSNNTRATAAARKELELYLKELRSGQITNARYSEISSSITQIDTQMRSIGKSGNSPFEVISQGMSKFSSWLGSSSLAKKAVTGARQAVKTIASLDTALVDFRKTTTMTAKELEDFYYTSNDVAKQMGVTTEEIISQAAKWSRLGFSSAEAATQMAKLSSQFTTISPGMSTDDTTASLVSIMKAYDIEVNDVLDGIMSKISEVGNKFATSNAEIAEGLRLSSAAMASTGATIEDNIALFTGAQEIVQNASQVGNAIRSFSLRIRGFDEETEELSDDLVDVSGQVANLTKVAGNGNLGISLFTASSQTEYKNLVQYLGEISEIWDELDQKTQNDILEKLFGKNHAQVGAAIIQNMDTVRKSMDVMAYSAGSADREMSQAMDSIDYKMNMLKETGTGIAQNLFGREEMKTVLDVINSLGKGIDWLTDKLGLFGTLGAGAGLFAAFRKENVDYLKTPVCPLHI